MAKDPASKASKPRAKDKDGPVASTSKTKAKQDKGTTAGESGDGASSVKKGKKKRTDDADAEKAEKPTTMRLSKAENAVYVHLLEAAKSVKVDVLEEALNLERTQLTAILNKLSDVNLTEYTQVGKHLCVLARSRQEAKTRASMPVENKLVYDTIRAAGNVGIWTKTLKTKTNLHQTVISRVLKQLEKDKQVKCVKSVKTPTRRIYMLAELTPSAELSGGPWFHDNELDLDFINMLCMTVLNLIRNATWPKAKKGDSGALLPASHTPLLPSVWQLLQEIQQLRIVNQPLTADNLAEILDILVLDREIEKIRVAHLPTEWIDALESDKPKGRPIYRESSPESSDIDADTDIDGSDDDKPFQANGNGKNKRARKDSPGTAAPALKRPRIGSPPLEEAGEEDAKPIDGLVSFKRCGDTVIPPTNEPYNVYRALRHSTPNPYKALMYKSDERKVAQIKLTDLENPTDIFGLKMGLTELPCTTCPVRKQCNNRGRPQVYAPSPNAPSAQVMEMYQRSQLQSSIAKGTDDLIKMRVPGSSTKSRLDPAAKYRASLSHNPVSTVNPRGCIHLNKWLEIGYEKYLETIKDEDDEEEEEEAQEGV
ncbi:uncharacterized protein L969DRAFT_96746 [Mixia osmundae IAM 14324]|uniref:DNA-directed RNA polymerase III subunit RPC6 n=1 Tax=Mixia osmundae (strain CBS 9802 / IAM 14324 / JCM 22182 / KY 12970) TaxID=764103 RepID=G7DZL3_MIXOS|nr:uncharacterized protein L969DRAFT_96746 [Mixia osmundae IAM 14324]KEI37186.1 hypothetical protein L969DRAFT_96746 [Mixia osmundae IAM 14324]GAA96023.1 hypothetical protein E5Q_02683 [Mixia osmundae IAM 14324]